MNARVRRAVLLSLCAGAACTLGPAGIGEFEFAGNWTYEAVQDSPGPASIFGGMAWTSSGAVDAFEGAVSWTEELPGGALRPLSGPVSGLVVTDSIVDFTAVVAGVSRRHVGIVHAESTWGTWMDQNGDAASGTFVARRVVP